MHKTEVCKATLDPVWRETFDFSIVECNAQSSEMLTLRLFDWDWATVDDFMGEVEIPFSYLASNPGIEHSEWFTVNDDKTGMIDKLDKAVTGRVLLRWNLKYIGGGGSKGAYGEQRLRRRSTITRPNVASKVTANSNLAWRVALDDGNRIRSPLGHGPYDRLRWRREWSKKGPNTRP